MYVLFFSHVSCTNFLSIPEVHFCPALLVHIDNCTRTLRWLCVLERAIKGVALVSFIMALFLCTQIINSMIHGTSESSTPNSPAALSSSDDPEEAGTSSAGADQDGSADTELQASEDGPAADQSAPRQQRAPRKRKRVSGAGDYRQAQLTEQRLLRESFEAAHAREMELRERHLKLQESF